MRQKKEGLSTLEWQIYNFIKERSSKGEWTSQKEIQDFLTNNGYIDRIELRTIRRYIQEIRKDDTIQKIILTDYSKGYRLMTCEEEIDYLKKKKISILKRLKQYYKDVKRFNTNNQTKITFGEYERDFYESLVKIEN